MKAFYLFIPSLALPFIRLVSKMLEILKAILFMFFPLLLKFLLYVRQQMMSEIASKKNEFLTYSAEKILVFSTIFSHFTAFPCIPGREVSLFFIYKYGMYKPRF